MRCKNQRDSMWDIRSEMFCDGLGMCLDSGGEGGGKLIVSQIINPRGG